MAKAMYLIKAPITSEEEEAYSLLKCYPFLLSHVVIKDWIPWSLGQAPYRIGEDRIGEDRIGEDRIGEYRISKDKELIAGFEMSHTKDRKKAVMHIKDAPKKIQTQWKYAMQNNKQDWVGRMTDVEHRYVNMKENRLEIAKSVIFETKKLIDEMAAKLPQVANKTLIDVSAEKIRESNAYNDWYKWGAMGILTLAHLYRSLSYLELGDEQGGVFSAGQALALFPEQRDLPDLPHPFEVKLRACSALGECWYGTLDDAFKSYRSCAAAARLIVHSRKTKPDDMLIESFGELVPRLVEMRVRIKIIGNGDEAKRPYFSDDERMELGIGLYSSANFKCHNCHNTDGKLLCCGRCKSVWYCGDECNKKGWKNGHKRNCHGEISGNKIVDGGSSRFCRIKVDMTEKLLISIIKAKGGVHLVVIRPGQLIACCYDDDTKQIFDAVTDKHVKFE